jgi:aspartate dehydrogenase
MLRKRIGLIGAGTVAASLILEFLRTGEFEIAFVVAEELRHGDGLGLPPGVLTTDMQEAMTCPVDLVIEAAVPAILPAVVPGFLAASDFCAFSCTALADAAFEQSVMEACHRNGRSFYVPHGAVLALDGIADGRDVIESLSITTTKNGASLGLDVDAAGIIFEGSAREACRRFPRNVNVHASIAAAGIGFDRTVSRIIADPESRSMEHHIAVEGQGLSWDITITSQSLGGVTGSYTPLSAIGSVRRILGGGGLRFA